MRRLALGLSLVVLVVGGYFYASPHLALWGLRDALEQGDAIELGDRVDFPRVRESLKDQVNASILQNASEELEGNPFGALALGVMSKLLEGMVDSYVTPSGLAGLAQGRQPNDRASPHASTGGAATDPPEPPFSRARIDRESTSRFSAWVPTDSGEEIRFVFRRYGLSWRLTDIMIPLDE